MAGFREFQTGEVLTAANVDDFLAKQAVMKFADAAARDTALGTAVAGGNALREGMVAYLDDTDEVIKYDGTDWTSVGEASGLVAVKHALFTGTQTNSTAAGAEFAVTDLSISHSVADVDNRVILTGFITGAGSLDRTLGIRVKAGGTVVAQGDAASSRSSIGSALFLGNATVALGSGHFTFVYLPATTAAVTYEVFAVNNNTSTATMYINRSTADENNARGARGVSNLVLMEVKV